MTGLTYSCLGNISHVRFRAMFSAIMFSVTKRCGTDTRDLTFECVTGLGLFSLIYYFNIVVVVKKILLGVQFVILSGGVCVFTFSCSWSYCQDLLAYLLAIPEELEEWFLEQTKPTSLRRAETELMENW